MNPTRLFSVLVCLLPALPAVAFVTRPEPPKLELLVRLEAARPVGRDVRVDEASPVGDAARRFVERNGGQWTFRIDSRTERALLIQGSGVPLLPGAGNDLTPEILDAVADPDGQVTIETVEPLVRAFLDSQDELLLPSRGKLVFNTETSMRRMDGRLMTFQYDWLVDGVPVEEAGVFVRVNSGNITQVGAPFVGAIGLDVRPTVRGAEAVRRLLDHTGDAEVARVAREPRLLIQPEQGPAGSLEYRLVWVVDYRIAQQIESWRGHVDAHTGQIVGFRDTNAYARATGGIYPRTVIDDEVSAPMPRVAVQGPAGPVTADSAGEYPYAGGTVSSGLNGHWFDTVCQGCSNPSQPTVQQAVGSGRLDFGFGGVDANGNGSSTPADRNAFYHMNIVRDSAFKWVPGLGFLANTNYTTNVNIQDTCNAVYTGSAVNFYRSGGGCNNTGEISDVMYHEYGHGIDQNTNGGDGATGEATADMVAMHITHSPLIGPWFRTNGTSVRDLDSTTSSHGFLSVSNIGSICPVIGSLGPLGYEVHCEGEIYGQAGWDLAQALVAKYGQQTGWRESERIFYGSLPDANGYLANDAQPVYDAYINADDDDGNLLNGTPNATEIFSAFDSHGIANAQVFPSAACLRPTQPSLSVVERCDGFDLSWSGIAGIDHYEVLRAAFLEDQMYLPVATLPAGQTTYVDNEVAPGVPYWYVVLAVTGSGCESTIESPVPANLPAQPILSVSALVDDDEPRGNRSGFPDPGEEVDLIVTLTNFGQVGATGLSGTLASSTPGVTVLSGNSTWADLAGGGSGDNQDVLRFETDEQVVACGDTLDFQLLPGGPGCSADTSYFQLALGETVVEAADGFESDLGWAPDVAASTASTGAWVRGNPVATDYQPGDDVTDPGTDCWYTGANPGGAAGTDDVDGGVVVLLSPSFDLSALSSAQVSYFRWYALSEAGTDPGDFFAAEVSDNGGATWVELETLDHTQPAPTWTERRFNLGELIDLTADVRFRFSAADGTLDGSVVEAAIDEFRISRLVCDDTPACFAEPTFAGLQGAATGSSCGETQLVWAEATSNCFNAEITYNVYRSTVPGFVPGPGNLAYTGLGGTQLVDAGLEPGQTYHYVVRAHDSRSGEDGNLVEGTAVAPVTPDIAPPVFAGIETAATGAACGETLLLWQPAIETCNAPVAYDIYRSDDAGFTPGPSDLVATTYSVAFIDTSVTPGVPHTYVIRARDDAGNAEGNNVKITVDPGSVDLEAVQQPFESGDGGWSVGAPNDAVEGNWEWGDPVGTAYQPADDATSGSGFQCWMTGLDTTASNGDVDGGTTTLLSAQYDMSGMVNPRVGYSRWFTNDRGASPGDATDTFLIEVSNDDGGNWATLEEIGAGTPLEWVPQLLTLPLPPSDQMRFRFTARDLGNGSIVEAGIDEFSLVDVGQGCNTCGVAPTGEICAITANRSGDDIVLDWSVNPVPGFRAVVYGVSGCGERIKLGTSLGNIFVHQGGALSSESFNYRVTFVDECGTEQGFCGTNDCP